MVTYFFPQVGEFPIIKYLKKGLECRHSAIFIAALTLVSNLFSLEIPVFYIFAFIVAFGALFCDDMLPLLPMACCGYYTFSKVNNPLDPAHTSIFITPSGLINFCVAASIVGVFVLARLIFSLITNKTHRPLPKLTWGFVVLGISYILGGILSPYYTWNTSFFGLIQIISISFSYFYFYFTSNIKKIENTYFAYLMTVVGLLLVGETIGMLYHGGFFTTTGAFNRSSLYTGWGVNNNVAGAIIICIPAPLYYATVKKKPLPYYVIGALFYFTILLTQSRAGMLFGTVIYGVSLWICLWKTENKRSFWVFHLLLLSVALLLCILFHQKIANLFASVISAGFNSSGRLDIYYRGLEQFIEYPIFGNGFYACEINHWGDANLGTFLPGRYHNTPVQLLASGGLVAFLSYTYHRYQTAKLVFEKPNVEKYFLGTCILGLLLISLLDCHFFNFGPGLSYSALLLLLEANYLKGKDPKKTVNLLYFVQTEQTEQVEKDEEL